MISTGASPHRADEEIILYCHLQGFLQICEGTFSEPRFFSLPLLLVALPTTSRSTIVSSMLSSFVLIAHTLAVKVGII